MGWELEDVEKPFVSQLEAVGWTHVEGSLDDPAVTGRASFGEVIQEAVLRAQLRALNPGPDGQYCKCPERTAGINKPAPASNPYGNPSPYEIAPTTTDTGGKGGKRAVTFLVRMGFENHALDLAKQAIGQAA